MNTLGCIAVGLTLLGLSLAQSYGDEGYKSERRYKAQEYHQSASYGEEKGDGYDDDKKNYKGGRYYYGGRYQGKCGPDGLYYRDEYSFVLCSNSKGYVQPCAPGTRNSGYNDYAPGYYYGYSDFCDVNLVDHGYAAPKYGPGYGDQPIYGFQAYRYPAGTGYAHKSEGSYGKAYNKYESGYGKASSGYNYKDRQSYGREQSGYEQASYGSNAYKNEGYKNEGYKNDGYQTRTGFGYKDGAKH